MWYLFLSIPEIKDDADDAVDFEPAGEDDDDDDEIDDDDEDAGVSLCETRERDGALMLPQMHECPHNHLFIFCLGR